MRNQVRAAIYMVFTGLVLLSFPARAAIEVTYYITDVLGSPVAATDANGTVIWRTKYRPYGDKAVTTYGASGVTDAAETRRWYTGHVEDVETGLVYMQARYYDPVIGRFMGVDPQGFSELSPISFNRYAYANNNPYTFKDPDGQSAVAAVRTAFQTDVAFPEPSDAAWPKWVGWGVALAGAAAIDYVVLNETAKGPDVPGTLVGEQDVKSSTQGGRHNSGPLSSDNGGTANAGKDFEKLTGGKSGPAPADKGYPEGTVVGENGISLRPGTEKSGPRIDIPAQGDKPAETLHYPKPVP